MTDFRDDDQFEQRLRSGLHDRARQAPDAGPVSDQILGAVESGAAVNRGPDHPRWRTWGLPLVAAAAVAAVVGGAVGVSHLHFDADKNPPVHQSTISPSTPAPSTPAPSSPSGSAVTSDGTPPPNSTALTHLQVRDLTFVGADQGWALGTADCLAGSGTCTALAYTSDGRSWSGRGATPFNVLGVTGGCSDPCVTNIRFATAATGYAFGPSALFLTTDGARSWQRLSGGAKSLETLNGYVLRVAPAATASCSYCTVLERGAIGGSSWARVSVPGLTAAGAVEDVGFAGQTAFAYGPISESYQQNLLVSTDGNQWTDRGRPCGSSDLIHVAGSSDGAMVVECAPHEGGSGALDTVRVSTDGGRSFGPTRTIAQAAGYSDALTAASATTILAAQNDAVRRTTNGGQSWQAVQPSGTVDFAGFESSQVGRVVTDGSTIWTTRDGGATWTRVQLG